MGRRAKACDVSGMVDFAFSLQGRFVPSCYARPLWEGIYRVLPWLAGEPEAGLLPLRGHDQGEGIWLPHRSKLVLRLPRTRAEEAQALCGAQIAVGTETLAVGQGELRPHRGYPTLHAAMVASELDETAFHDQVRTDLATMGIGGQWICGRQRTLRDEVAPLHGFSLVVHHLTPSQSLQLQGCGLGQARHLGCGIFVPYKSIPNLE